MILKEKKKEKKRKQKRKKKKKRKEEGKKKKKKKATHQAVLPLTPDLPGVEQEESSSLTFCSCKMMER